MKPTPDDSPTVECDIPTVALSGNHPMSVPRPAVVRPEVREACAALLRLGACSVPEVRALVAGPMGVPAWERATVGVAEGITATVSVGATKAT